MKSISTLVSDIYKLLEDNKAVIDADRLAKVIAARLAQSGKSDVLRMSKLGEKCERKLWYQANMPEVAEKLPGHTLLKFLIGDIHEEIILSLAEAAGHDVKGRQDEVSIDGVLGHRDAIIDGVLVDVKSANSRGMEKFRTHSVVEDDPFGYHDQLQAYLAASQDDVQVKGEAAFLASDKELGHLVLDKYKKKDIDWKAKIQRLRAILAEKNPPKRAYDVVPEGKSGNLKIPMECSYCQFKNECYKNSNGGKGLRKFFYSKGPVWFTHIEKEPRDNVKEEM